MLPIAELTIASQELLIASNIRILLDIIKSFYCVKGKITTRNISRYSNSSLRTLFRFLSLEIDWIGIRIRIFKYLIFNNNSHYIAAIDEVVEGKSRKKSHGIGIYYSSIFGKPIPSICFSALSLIDTASRTSYPMAVEQLIYTEEDKTRIAKQKAEKKAGKERSKAGAKKAVGRKKGSKAKEKEENPTAAYRTMKSLLSKFKDWWKKDLPELKITHLVADAAFGTLDYLNMAKSNEMFLISRLRDKPELYLPYNGAYKGIGRPSVYGDRVDIQKLPKEALKKVQKEDGYTYYIYQFKAYNKSICGILLNIVVIRAVRERDGQQAHKVFFTNDLELDFQTLLDYYSLRFQIEFNFRDAKQYFGLSDFKNYKKNNLTNFVNLSFLMCLIDKIVIREQREVLNIPKLNTADLKVIFNGRFTAQEIIKLLQKNPDLIFNNDFCEQYMPQGLIHRA